MADSASLYSTTDTLVDVDVDVSVLGRNTYLPGDVGPIHVSLFTVYDRAPPSADRLTSVGFPSSRSRGQASTGRILGSLQAIRKKLQVQIPVRDAFRRWEEVAEARDEEEVAKRQQAIPTSRKIASMWELQLAELVGVRERPRLAFVLAALFKATDVRDSFAVFPASRVVSCHSSLKDSGGAKVAMQWVSVTLTAPTTWREDDDGKDVNFDDDEASSAAPGDVDLEAFWAAHPSLKPGHRETPSELLSRLYIPSQHSRRTVTRIVGALERQGALISHAGLNTRPSASRPEPQKRPMVQILGAMPQFLVNKLRRAAGKKSGVLSQRDADALCGGAGEGGDEEEASMLIVRTDGGGEEADDTATALNLRGWQVRIQNEPYLSGQVPYGFTALGGGFGAVGGGF